jgi:hyperosmotically inducible protein
LASPLCLLLPAAHKSVAQSLKEAPAAGKLAQNHFSSEAAAATGPRAGLIYFLIFKENIMHISRVAHVLFRTVLSSLLAAGSWASLAAQDTAPAADNTKVNQRDRNTSEPTADRQKSAKSDREMTRKIRQALTQDKSLSTYAHNVKIITQNGMVTLKGPVRSGEEKKAVEAKATEIAGDNKVTSNLDVTPKN